MAFVLLNWMIILLTAVPIGYALLVLAGRCFGYQVKRIDASLIAGLVAATTYAQTWSLFGRVNWEAFSVWALLALVLLVAFHGQLWTLCRESVLGMGRIRGIVFAVLILLVLYFTSRGYYLTDTNLYHAQSIRWLEEYGALKGLGNIQSRASYNSSFFPLTALYSMKYLFGQSMHTVQGLLALLLAGECTSLGKILTRKHALLSDFARIAAVYYLTLLYKQIISPTSDYAVMIVLFYVFIRWLALLDEREESEVPYALLCMVGAYTVTLKLTAGLVLLLVLKPLIRLIRKGKVLHILGYVVTGVIIVAPYLIRNVIISGWLLYPSTAIDLFPVDWKVPKVIADADAFQIRSWGKGIHEYGIFENLPSSWMPNWFVTMLTSTEKVLILLDALAILVILVLGVLLLVQSLLHRTRRITVNSDRLLVLVTLMVSFLFWLMSAPLTRYGYTYILLLFMITGGDLAQHLFTPDIFEQPRLSEVHFAGRWVSGSGMREKIGYRLLIAALAVLLCWKGAVLAHGVYTEWVLGYFVQQADYENNEGSPDVKTYQINGITFYAHVSGYHSLPGGGITFTMRGKQIRDGFRYEDKSEQSLLGE